MRAVPFAMDNVISMLNRFYVPVYVANEDVYATGAGKMTAEEKGQVLRIKNEAGTARMRFGDVCVYIAGPDGKTIDALKVPELYEPPQNTVDLLQRTIDRLKLKEGKPLVKPAPQSVAPKSDADSLVLHIVVREDNQAHSWQHYPAENWIAFSKAEWAKFLPPPGAPSWEVDPAVAKKLLTFFYPGTEDSHSDQVDRNVIERASLQAKVLPGDGKGTRVELVGTLKMGRRFYPGKLDMAATPLEASAWGILEIGAGKPEIKSFRLATESASYGGKKFGASASHGP
jgi:hypothetical protein